MPNNNYQNVAIGDVGTQLFWFNLYRLGGVTITDNADFTVDVDSEKFLKKVDFAASTTFTYATTGTTWKIDTTAVNMADYGITVTGSPANGNTITITYSGSKFEYAVPVTAGAEFGGDSESFDAPETDLPYVPKVLGRPTLNDISYTVNYTKEKYKRVLGISDDDVINTYMEVFSDGSAMIFKGTSNEPTITAGDVRQINWTIIPNFKLWIDDIANLSAKEKASLDARMYTDNKLNIDTDSIPSYRPDYYTAKNI